METAGLTAGLIVRVVLLTILLWAAMIFAVGVLPREATAQEFSAALDGHRVTFVSYELNQRKNVSDVHWSTGGLTWYRVGDLGAYTEEDLYSAAGEGLHPELRKRRPGGGGLFPDWPFEVHTTAGWVAGAAWILTLLLMLGTPELRYANRWAWFWMFTVGQAGAILFLLLEPRSLWYGTQPQAPRATRMSGSNGCLTSIGLAIASGLAVTFFALGIRVFD